MTRSKPFCKAQSFHGRLGLASCARLASRDGYCGIHHPDSIAKRKAKSDAFYTTKIQARDRKWVEENEGDEMSDTPFVDTVLSHQGATHQDCITRLENLIPLARRLECERTLLANLLDDLVNDMNALVAFPVDKLRAARAGLQRVRKCQNTK